MRVHRALGLGGLLLIFASQWSLLGCGEDRLGDTWIATTISGTVSDDISGDPIESATIIVGGNKDTVSYDLTDSMGFYRVAPAALGPSHELDYLVTCSKAGYLSQTDTVHTSPSRRVIDSVNFRLILE